MLFKRISIPCLAAMLALTGAGRAAADAGDAIAGALVGGIIGHAIAKDKQRNRTVYVQRAPRFSSAQRQENRNLQTALNYFGFGAGAVDGAIGPGTRGAVSRFQAQMGYPASGHIQPHEQNFLMAAHSWAISGGAATTAARTPQELLMAYQQRMVAPAPQMAFTQPAPQMVAPPATTVVVTPQATPEPAAPAPTEAVAAAAKASGPAAPVLPNFMGSDRAMSLASHCNQVALVTSSNGGFTTAANLTDPGFALDEQFCLARTYAIADGEDLAAGVSGVSPGQISEQCRGFGPALQPYVAALSLRPGEEVLGDVAEFVLGSGMSPGQLAGTARICLSVGYRTDDMEVALGSALLLAALGEHVYGELMGHHLVNGFGTSRRPDLAAAWYELGLDAVGSGGRSVFAPGQPERQDLIRAAASRVTGAGGDEEASGAATVLPTFSIQQ